MLHRLAAEIETRGVPGVLLDCGVWNGGSTVLLSAGAPSRLIWAFDSFETVDDLLEPLYGAAGGSPTDSEAKLWEAFSCFADPERLRVARGWFSESFSRVESEIPEVALISCATESYAPVLSVLDTFYRKLNVGGYAVINTSWPSARRAVDDFRSARGITSPLRSVGHAAVYWRRA